MKKYDIPTIKISSFLCENVLTGSGIQRDYIPEVNAISAYFDANNPEYAKRMEDFSQLMQFSQ